MGHVLGKTSVEPHVTGKYRMGDIRHCFADITLTRAVLGYAPRVTLAEGLTEMVDWLAAQIPYDRVDRASAELAKRGLMV
jgi:dTDP-L-rhamnose 4-epimerase